MTRKKSAPPLHEPGDEKGTYRGQDGQVYVTRTYRLRLDLRRRMAMLKADPNRPELGSLNDILNKALDLGLRALELGVATIDVDDDETEAADGSNG